MMTRSRFRMFLAAVVFCGCATYKPLYVADDYAAAGVRTIALLPIQDVRADPTTKLDLESGLRRPLIKKLERRGYEVVGSTLANVDPFAVQQMSATRLAGLGNPGADATMAVFLEDASHRYFVMGNHFKIELSARLVDRASGRVLWHDKIVHSSGHGGLISGLVPVKAGGLSSATSTICGGIPKFKPNSRASDE